MAYSPARAFAKEGENGHIVIGKVMIQWGVHTISALTAHTLNFATPFRAAPYFVSLQGDNMGDDVGSDAVAIDFSTVTAEGITINPDDVAHAINDEIRYLVIGPVITN